MKPILLALTAILLAACASNPPKKIVFVPGILPDREMEGTTVRKPEEVRQYRFGRYVDPGCRLVMHEAHPVYRIERTAGWELRPSGALQSTRTVANEVVAAAPPDDAVIAEINRQKAATKTFTEQAATLNQRLSGLTDAVVQTKQMAEQQLLQRRDIAALNSRLTAFEKERADKPANTASKPAAAPEEKW